MSGPGTGARVALVVGSVVLGLGGWFAVKTVADADAPAAAPGAVDLYSCPMDGAQSIGQLQPGDDVWLIGVSDGRWGVIQDPDTPDRPAFVALSQLGITQPSRDLPEMGCDANPSTGTTVPPTTVAPSTSIASTGSTSTTTTSSTSTTSTTTTSTTIPGDRVPPTVTLTADREYLYVSPSVACPDETALEVTVAVVDPTVPLTIRSIVAEWAAPAGPQQANLTPIGGTKFQLVIPDNGPPAGETPLTITATASDGAGNVGTGVLTVSLRDPRSFGCA
jgi:hypothetical protein